MKKSEVTKQKLLEAAEEAFSEKGLYGARVDEIAEVAKINKRMIYAYFGSKEKLYLAVLGNVYQKMAQNESDLLEKYEDCAEAVEKIIENAFEFLNSNPNFVKMVMWENLHYAQYLKQSNAPTAKAVAIDLLRKVLLRGIKEGVFRDDFDVEELIISINMFCYSYFSNIHTMTYIMNVDFYSEEEKKKRCKHITDMILQYIKK